MTDEKLRAVYVPAEEGLGHVEIRDELGHFAGYDPTPVQVARLCVRRGYSNSDIDQVWKNTDAHHQELVDDAFDTRETDVPSAVYGAGLIATITRAIHGNYARIINARREAETSSDDIQGGNNE